MKKPIFFFFLAAALVAPAIPALAAGSCCVEMQPNSSTVLNCAQMLDTTCPTGTNPIDCSIEPKCSAFAKSVVESEAPTKAEFEIKLPKIPLDIPTVSLPEFANVTQKDGYIYIPFISIFLVGAYKMGVGIASVLAVIMIMAGGLVWIAAAGDSGKIGKAKTMISGAVVGLVLTLGSYVALQTVNPDLVNFTALKIKTVDQRQVDVVDDYNYETVGDTSDSSPPIASTPSQYDSIFQKYAPCAGVTPEALKAIAQAESGLNPNASHGSFAGFFQIGKKYCPKSMASKCADLTNPDNNTAVAASMIKASVNKIKSRCPAGTSAHDQMIMIYIGHNNGPGALDIAMKNGCDTSTMKNTLTDYYANTPGGMSTALKYTNTEKPGIACLGDRTDAQSRAECTAGPKFAFTEKLAKKSDGAVSQVISTSSTFKCPY